jgi:hypothetical protein
MLLAKEEMVLQDMNDKRFEIGRYYRMEIGKNESDENLKTTISSKTCDRPYTSGDVEFFKYLGSKLTNDERCTIEIKSMIAMAKAAFNKKRALFLKQWT